MVLTAWDWVGMLSGILALVACAITAKNAAEIRRQRTILYEGLRQMTETLHLMVARGTPEAEGAAKALSALATKTVLPMPEVPVEPGVALRGLTDDEEYAIYHFRNGYEGLDASEKRWCERKVEEIQRTRRVV